MAAGIKTSSHGRAELLPPLCYDAWPGCRGCPPEFHSLSRRICFTWWSRVKSKKMSQETANTGEKWFDHVRTDFSSLVGEWYQGLSVGEFAFWLSISILAVVFRRTLASYLLILVRLLLRSLSTPIEDDIIDELKSPAQILIVAATLLFLVQVIGLPDLLYTSVRQLLLSVVVISIFASLFRIAHHFVSMVAPRAPIGKGADTDWATRVVQLAIIIIAIAAILDVWKINVSGALTGVGILGAGIAIAAQDFVRNLVAGMSNLSEERFVKGDWIEAEGLVEGIVHKIDVRSTTILGFDRIPHYVPNSELANAVIRNKTRRDHRRVHWIVNLVLSTSADQLRTIVDGLHAYLEESGDFVVEDDVFRLVHTGGLSESSVDVVIYAFTKTNGYAGYLEATERLTHAIRNLVDSAGTQLAYPTRSVYVEKSE